MYVDITFAATNPQQYNTHVNITNSSRVFEEDQLDNKFGKLQQV